MKDLISSNSLTRVIGSTKVRAMPRTAVRTPPSEESEGSLRDKFRSLREREKQAIEAEGKVQTVAERKKLEKDVRKQQLARIRGKKTPEEDLDPSVAERKKKLEKMGVDIAKYKHLFRGQKFKHQTLHAREKAELCLQQKELETIEVCDFSDLERELENSKRIGAAEDLQLLLKKQAS